MGAAIIVELTADEWEVERDNVTRRILGISAVEFIQNFNSGLYDADPPEDLMEILGYFPDLD